MILQENEFWFFTEAALDVVYEGKLYVSEASPFNITCFRAAYGSPKWYRNGLVIDPLNTEFSVFGENKSPSQIFMGLSVEKALWRHRGDYKCDSLSEKTHKIEIVPSRGKYVGF